MNLDAKILGRPRKNDTRSIPFYIEELKIRATDSNDPYVLAAIYRALTGKDDFLLQRIEESAKACKERHQAIERKRSES